MTDSYFLELQAALAGRFSLEREIGRGGMGIVYLARDVTLERAVAIKLLAPGLGAREDMRLRFLREARIAAQCFHPNIVPIHAVGESGPLAWFVMPYVRGETLAERVRRLGPLQSEEVRRLGQEIGWALAYAHQRGVVHRDVKPENVLIEASSGRFLIADFGIAVGGDQSGTSSSSGATGTPRYMAPEQALGEAVDGRADLYALGVTLFVAATARAPFDGASVVALLAQHATAPAPAVRALAPTLPLSIADAIDRCLAKQPDDRFPSAEQFVEALELGAGEAVAPPALAPIVAGASSVRSLVGWSAAVTVCTLLLALGETSSFGRGILVSLGTAMAASLALLGAARLVEALVVARRALRAGHDAEDIERALEGHERVLAPTGAARWRSAGAVLAGTGLALAQGVLTSLNLPDFAHGIVQFGLIFAPPVLIARGAAGLTSGTRLSRWLRERVIRPCARFATFAVSRGIPRASRAALESDAPTELLLERAIRNAVAMLPDERRATLGDALERATSLAREVEAIRREDVRLADEERAARLTSDVAVGASAIARVAAERGALRSRLATAVAALEAVRLEVLRLDAGLAPSLGITTHLEAVREVERRVDAHDPPRPDLVTSDP